LGSLKLKVVAGVVTEIPSLNDEFQGRDRVLKSQTFYYGNSTKTTRPYFKRLFFSPIVKRCSFLVSKNGLWN